MGRHQRGDVSVSAVDDTRQRAPEVDRRQDRGEQVEEHVFDGYPVEQDRAEWHDGRVAGSHPLQAGRKVEVKSARRWIKNGDGRTRGRYHITDANHSDLAAADGLYFFAVYETDGDDVDVRRERVIPAREVHARTEGEITFMDRSPAGKRGRPARINWRRVFPE
jgi:hypothetical protein